jgi:putative ABC transport system permease protein
MLQIIRDSLARRWVQSLSTLVAVAVGVGILFALYLLYLGVSGGLEIGQKRLGADIVVVPTDAQVEPETLLFTGAPLNIYMNKDLEAKVAAIPGVARVTPQFFAQTLNAACCDVGATRLIGFDPKTDWLVRSWVKNLPGGAIGPEQVLIGSGVTGVTGNTVTILKEQFHVAAVLQPTATSLDDSILMPIDTARSVASTSPYLQLFWEKLGDPRGLISALLVDVDPHVQKIDVVIAIDELGDFNVIQASDVLQKIKDQMKVLFLLMLGGGLLAAAASVFQFFARFFSLAWDRKGEWGLYRALGATRRDLKLLIAGEALTLTLGGVIAGLALGYALFSLILIFLQNQKAFPFIEPSFGIVLSGIAAIAVFFSLLGILSAWWPAQQSGKIEPSSAMAMGDIE